MDLSRTALALAVLAAAALAVLPCQGSCQGGWGAAFGDSLVADPVVGEDIFAVVEDGGRLDLMRIGLLNGTLMWRVVLPVGTPRLSPAIAGDSVVCAHGNGVYGFDIATGVALWNLSIAQTVAPASDGDLLVMSNGSWAGGFSTAGRPSPLWNLSIASPPDHMAIAEGRVFIGTGPSSFDAVDADNGTRLWGFSASGELAGPPVAAGDRTFAVGTDGNVSLLDGTGDTIEWADVGPTHCAPRAFDGGVLLGLDDGSAIALDQGLFRTWNASADAPVTLLMPSADAVLVMDLNGTLTAFSPSASAEVLWAEESHPFPEGSTAPSGEIVIWAADGRIAVIDGRPSPRPHIDQGSFFLTSDPPLEGKRVRMVALLANYGPVRGEIEVLFLVDGTEVVRTTATVEAGSVVSVSAWWKAREGEHLIAAELGAGWNASAEGGRAVLDVEVVGRAAERDLRPVLVLMAGLIALWCLVIAAAIVYSRTMRRRGARKGGRGGGRGAEE